MGDEQSHAVFAAHASTALVAVISLRSHSQVTGDTKREVGVIEGKARWTQ
jgi:hypothetical protein